MISNYRISGMTCGHCVKAVTEEVSDLAGVEKVEVELADGKMMVYSQQPLTIDEIKAAVAEAGDYTVVPA